MNKQPVIEVTVTSRGTRFTDPQVEQLKQAVSDAFAKHYNVSISTLGGRIVTVENSHRVVWSFPRHLFVFAGQPAPDEQVQGVVVEGLVAAGLDGVVSVQGVVEVFG